MSAINSFSPKVTLSDLKSTLWSFWPPAIMPLLSIAFISVSPCYGCTLWDTFTSTQVVLLIEFIHYSTDNWCLQCIVLRLQRRTKKTKFLERDQGDSVMHPEGGSYGWPFTSPSCGHSEQVGTFLPLDMVLYILGHFKHTVPLMITVI